MTPEERAEKIIRELGYGYANERKPDDSNGLGFVAAEIREAVEEGIRNYKPPIVRKQTISEIVIEARKEAKAEAYEEARRQEDMRAAAQALEEIKLREQVRKEALRAGALEAYEDAAKIAEQKYRCPDFPDQCDDVASGNAFHCLQDYGTEIAKEIRARAKEVTNDKS